MAAAVLRSPDCIGDRFRQQTVASPVFKPRRKPNSNHNPNPNPKANPKLDPAVNSNSSSRWLRRKRSSVGSHDSGRGRGLTVVKSPAVNLVMGQVTILKRGEKLSSVGHAGGEAVGCLGRPTAVVEEKDLVLSSTERLGPEPDTVQKQIRVSEFNIAEGIFSGSAAVASPPPSSLPFPAFFAKKEKKNDVATSDLRRLLRLDVL